MTKEDFKALKETNEWCKKLGLPPITFAELKRYEQIRKSAWGMAYTSTGVKYFT
ncbi:MAG: hypothetical protein IJ724_01405 [Muribaculaceae bacterium]|nr:hypothetical protein [Muribaculaceae bacterium]